MFTALARLSYAVLTSSRMFQDMILLVHWLTLCSISRFLFTGSCTELSKDNVTVLNLSTQHYSWKILAIIIHIINCSTTKSCALITAWCHTGVGHRVEVLSPWHRLTHGYVLSPLPPDSFGTGSQLFLSLSFLFNLSLNPIWLETHPYFLFSLPASPSSKYIFPFY